MNVIISDLRVHHWDGDPVVAPQQAALGSELTEFLGIKRRKIRRMNERRRRCNYLEGEKVTYCRGKNRD